LQGEPIVLVENGQLIDRNMRRERLTLDDLAEKARMSEIASIDEIKWAVLETNGDISFTKQSAASNGGPLPAGPRGSLPGSSALDAGTCLATRQSTGITVRSDKRPAARPTRSPGGYRSSARQSIDRCVCAWNRSPLT
jgi:Protein of unknown function (DUF421)